MPTVAGTNSPTTYDPQKNTFIKAPEAKFCPECGQQLPSEVQPMKNDMNNYITASGNVACINNNENVIEVGTAKTKFYKVTGYDKKTQKYLSDYIPRPSIQENADKLAATKAKADKENADIKAQLEAAVAKVNSQQAQQQVQQSTTIPTADNPIPVPISKMQAAQANQETKP